MTVAKATTSQDKTVAQTTAFQKTADVPQSADAIQEKSEGPKILGQNNRQTDKYLSWPEPLQYTTLNFKLWVFYLELILV